MAIIGTLNADNKYNSYCEEMKDAYFKIVRIFVDTDKEKIVVSVRGWLSEYARHNQGIGIFKRNFYIPFDKFANIKCTKIELVKCAYSYISKLPEFSGFKKSLKKYLGKIDITEEKVKKDNKELDELIRDLQQ